MTVDAPRLLARGYWRPGEVFSPLSTASKRRLVELLEVVSEPSKLRYLQRGRERTEILSREPASD